MSFKHTRLMGTAILAGLLLGCTDASTASGDQEVAGSEDAVSEAAAIPLLAITSRGQGRDVVLIPGLASGTDIWDTTAADFVDTHRVHLVQLSGFAGAEASNLAIDPDDYLDTLSDALVASLGDAGAETPILVGHSLGGALALNAAIDHPDAVSGLVVVDALPFYSALFDANATVESVQPMAKGMAAQMAAMDDATYANMQAQGAARYAKTPVARARIADAAVASDRTSVTTAVQALMTTDLRPRLGEVAVPTTVIHAHDPAMGRGAQDMADFYAAQYDRLEDVRHVAVPDSFHFIMDDQPEAFRAALDTAIADITGGN